MEPTTSTTTLGPPPLIFETDFQLCTTMRVGYINFPVGTAVSWRVWQSHGRGTGTPVLARGSFNTLAAANHNHFLSIPLGSTLKPDPWQTHVVFTRTIGGVTTNYKLERDPGCGSDPDSNPRGSDGARLASSVQPSSSGAGSAGLAIGVGLVALLLAVFGPRRITSRLRLRNRSTK
jgi:hypothetical protein